MRSVEALTSCSLHVKRSSMPQRTLRWIRRTDERTKIRVRAHVFASNPILRPSDSRGGTTMSINFNPNDPQAGSTAPAMREKSPRANRPTSKSGFTFTGTSQEGKFNPDTPQFLFWQGREAALAAVETWESVAGPHMRWQGNRKKLPLRQDAGQDLNAFYDRTSFSFFHQ